MKKSIIFFAVTICSVISANAQQDSAKLYQKLSHLFALMNISESISNSAKSSADQTITNAPGLAGRKEEAIAFFDKYVGWPAFQDDLVKIYSKYYTIKEVDELIKFYQSPVIKKLNANAAAINQEIGNRQAEKLQAHGSELSQLLPNNNVIEDTPAQKK